MGRERNVIRQGHTGDFKDADNILFLKPEWVIIIFVIRLCVLYTFLKF